jgi:hypothetical protein
LAAAIAKATRGAKDDAASRRREEIWAEAASARGIDVEKYVENLRHPDRILDREASERLLAERLAELPKSLTENQSVVERKDVLRAVASALVGTGLPATRVDVEIKRLLDTRAIVEIGRDQLDRPRYSTPKPNGKIVLPRRGAKVADIGCGTGYSKLIMARAFPNSTFIGYDFHKPSIENAMEHARESGGNRQHPIRNGDGQGLSRK